MTQPSVEKIGRTYIPERGALHGIEEFAQRNGNEDEFSIQCRLIEIEAENLRLQRLVADLLVKNQKLRELLCENTGSTSSDAAATCGRDDAAMEPMRISSR